MLAASSSRSGSALACTLSSVPRHARTMMSVKPAVVYPDKPAPRIYGERKTYLYNAYTRLFESSTTTPLVFLQHKDFTAQRLVKLRRDVAVALEKHAAQLARSRPPSLDGPKPAAPEPAVSITVLRTSLFGVALRDYAPIDAHTAQGIAGVVEGGLAVLALPAFDPPQLQAILRALERSVPHKKVLSPEALAAEAKARAEAEARHATPGRRQKRMRPILTPELKVMGALIDGRVFGFEGVKHVSSLPSFDTIRAQLVGLLSAPASQLAAVLGQASGGQLSRTLEGFKKSLEEVQGEDAQGGASSSGDAPAQ